MIMSEDEIEINFSLPAQQFGVAKEFARRKGVLPEDLITSWLAEAVEIEAALVDKAPPVLDTEATPIESGKVPIQRNTMSNRKRDPSSHLAKDVEKLGRTHRPDFNQDVDCPKCKKPSTGDDRKKPGLCPYCGWVNNAVARRGYAPHENSTGDSKMKMARHKAKRALKKAEKLRSKDAQ